MTLIERYYSDADFYKSTGDGLLVVTHLDEETLLDQMDRAVRTALAVVDAFHSSPRMIRSSTFRFPRASE